MSGASINHQLRLAGQRIVVLGDLIGMPEREAKKIIELHGGVLVDRVDATANVILVSDNCDDLEQLMASNFLLSDAALDLVRSNEVRVVTESELWQMLEMAPQTADVAGLYTLAMLAEVLNVPKPALRRWQRRGYIRATSERHRLCYFNFDELCVARILTELLVAGCSLAVIDRKVSELARIFADVERPLAELPLQVDGSRLYLRRGDGLTEPSGQLLMEFELADDNASPDDRPKFILSLRSAEDRGDPAAVAADADLTPSQRLSQLRRLAMELDERGELEQARECYRLILGSGEITAADNFLMADALYRLGDLAAARERYYMAVELDSDYVESWANLGCVCLELGALEQALASFERALACFEEYADVHYHLANVLDRLQRHRDAQYHWRRFLELAPASPWSDQARAKLNA